MHGLAELKRLNAAHMDARNYPRLHGPEVRLHPLVAASIASIEERVPLSDIVDAGRPAALLAKVADDYGIHEQDDGPYDPTRAGGLFEPLDSQQGD